MNDKEDWVRITLSTNTTHMTPIRKWIGNKLHMGHRVTTRDRFGKIIKDENCYMVIVGGVSLREMEALGL